MYRWHALLLAILAGECLMAVILHRSDAELRTLLDEGAGQQQVQALCVLTNRGVPHAMDRATLRKLVFSENELVQEWTMTTNFVRLVPPGALERYANSLGNSADTFRRRFLFTYRLGQRRSMTLAALARFLDPYVGAPSD